jgi:uncharacterized membrane protein HdeD (DUF308 family)
MSSTDLTAGPALPASFPTPPWWLVLLQGLASVVIGLLLLTETGMTLFYLVVFLGVYWLVGGVFDLVSLFVDRRHAGWKVFSGVIGIIAGLVIVRHPLWSSVLVPVTLVWVLAFIGILIGVTHVIRAFSGGGWGSAIVGLLSLLFGLILLARPLESLVVLVLLVAVWAVIGGAVAVVVSFVMLSRERRSQQARSVPSAPAQPVADAQA